MKIRKQKKGEGQSRVPEIDKFHQVHCPLCGQFCTKIKKKKRAEKVAFECSKCTGRFSLTFPGRDDDVEAWLRGEDNRFTTFKLRRRR